ncbi:class I SAM-dependent methyltransferase [Candidatus Saccharibacteria bacterium]|nr:class I SAM-dependent methyltransferase [Candidatus Saccharibacteria bacterium]
MSEPTSHKPANQYDDPSHNYLHYWDGRDYENEAERMAITRLLDGKHFKRAADIGGGYGRLCVFLEQYADRVTLAEPSQQQLDIGAEFLKDHPEIDRVQMQADELKFNDGELDLITMIRVMHHLPKPEPEFAELSRVLAPGGYLILEVANSTHARNRIKATLKGEKIPATPINVASAASTADGGIAFVNHHPATVERQLAAAGLTVERKLSVSNLRSPGLKKVLPRQLMLGLENVMQTTLASANFGPSMFLLVRKAA